jgi:hypothetical protein
MVPQYKKPRDGPGQSLLRQFTIMSRNISKHFQWLPWSRRLYAIRDNEVPMARWLKGKTSGKGAVLCGERWLGNVEYEIRVVGQDGGSQEVSGYFVPEPGVLSRLEVRNAALRLKDGEQVKLQIVFLPVSKRVEFEIDDPESIATCDRLAETG